MKKSTRLISILTTMLCTVLFGGFSARAATVDVTMTARYWSLNKSISAPATAKPATTPKATPTPEATATPKATTTPKATATPKASATPKATAKPAATPAPAGNTGNANVSADEQYMLRLINEERTKAGLSALTTDAIAQKAARIKAQDMLDNNYFAHTSPTYGSASQLMQTLGSPVRAVGENIAKNSTVLKAHVSFMNSDGHKRNILGSGYTHVGIGIVYDKNGFVTICEIFLRK